MNSSVHSTMNSLWSEVIETLIGIKRPIDSRNGPCYEMLAYGAMLTDPRNAWLSSTTRKASASYAAAELLWYLSGESKVDMLEQYAPSYRKFVGGHRIAKGAYGARIAVENQIERVVKVLKMNPDSRQAIMTMFWPSDLSRVALNNDFDDVPCTLSLQFLIRTGHLSLIANMRSNDAWRGLPYDVWCFTRIQTIIAAMLGVPVGLYVHQAGSMHIYEADYNKVVGNAVDTETVVQRYDNIIHPEMSIDDQINHALVLESMIKTDPEAVLHSLENHTPTLFDECVALCLKKRTGKAPSWLNKELQ